MGRLLRTGSARQTAATAAAVCVVGALVYSAWRDVPHSLDTMRSQHAIYRSYTPAQRERAFGALIPMPMEIFDFWRDGLLPSDRYWIQMPPMPFASDADKRFIARKIAHIYLLPAIESSSPANATIILTWEADPATLHLKYGAQREAGKQLIFTSRVDRGN